MANEEHLRILKQGVEVWNGWRKENRDIRPDLRIADLSGMNLSGAYFVGTDFDGADLSGSDLFRAILSGASFRRANLESASLIGVDLSGSDLTAANLRRADLSGANITNANLVHAVLRGASLTKVTLVSTIVDGTDFATSRFEDCILANLDLSQAKGLEAIVHWGPSFLDIQTFYRSKGRIHELFLQGAGVPKDFIDYANSLINKAIEFYSCFISYSSKDQGFAHRMHADLQQKGVRCWFAPEDMKIGDRIRVHIDESIRLHDKLLLVLSEHSVASAWVEQEVEMALERERRHSKTVLFPIRLDNAVMEVESGWPALVRNTRHIGDFTRWKNHDAYQVAFDRLLRDLKAEGG